MMVCGAERICMNKPAHSHTYAHTTHTHAMYTDAAHTCAQRRMCTHMQVSVNWSARQRLGKVAGVIFCISVLNQFSSLSKSHECLLLLFSSYINLDFSQGNSF